MKRGILMTPVFDRILIVMLENQYRSYTLQNPFMNKLRSAGMDLTNYFGCFHPSQTNYVASLMGEVCGITNDTPPSSPLTQKTLIDLLEAKGKSWKAYMEAYPEEVWKHGWKTTSYPAGMAPIDEYPVASAETGQPLAAYFRKHNAFASSHSIQAIEKRWARIVSDSQFWMDVQNGDLPDYGWYTPDIWNDGHYIQNTHIDSNPRTKLIPQVANWLEFTLFGDLPIDKVSANPAPGVTNIGLNLDFDLLLEDPNAAYAKSRIPSGTLIMVTFDEADFDAQGYDTNYDGPNQVLTVLLGDMIVPGSSSEQPLNHYSTMKTIERNFDLGSLGKNDQTANWVRDLWDEHFIWSGPQASEIICKGALSATHFDGASWVAASLGGGKTGLFTLKGDTLHEVTTLNTEHDVDLALSADASGLVLVWQRNGQLYYTRSKDGSDWPQPTGIPGATSVVSLNSTSLMIKSMPHVLVAWSTSDGFIQSAIWNGTTWTSVQPVGQLTDGPLVVGQMGPSAYIVYKERNTLCLRMTSMNMAEFNSFEAVDFNGNPAPNNNTSLMKWSVADWPVGHFARKGADLRNAYQTLGAIAMASIDGELRLVHRGAYADTPSVWTETFSLTGIFTASSQASNHFGTIRQAGWTVEQDVPGLAITPESSLAMSSDGTSYTLFWQEDADQPIQWRSARYSQPADQS